MPKPSRESIDEEIQRVLQDPIYGEELSAFNITNHETAALLAFHAALDTPPATDNEKKICQSFIENLIGNMDFNESIKFVLRKDLSQTGFNTPTLAALRDLSYRTRHRDKIEPLFQKIESLFNAILEDKLIDQNDRFSIPDVGMISDLSKTRPILDAMKNSGLLEGSPMLTQLSEMVNKSAAIINKLELNYQKSMVNLPGSLVFDDTQKKASLKGVTLGVLETAVKSVITSHGHASRLFSTFDPETKRQDIQVSHINPTYQVEKFDLLDFLYSDIYKIELDKLIRPEDRKLLEDSQGENWLNDLNRIFKLAERELHDESLNKLAGIGAPSEWSVRMAGAKSLLGKYIGHAQWSKTDFKQIHAKMFSDFYSKNDAELLCSEFVAQSLIAALIEVNKELKERLKLPSDKDIIQLPISPYENLSTMLPDRLLAVLEEKNCVRRLEAPSSIAKYIKPT